MPESEEKANVFLGGDLEGARKSPIDQIVEDWFKDTENGKHPDEKAYGERLRQEIKRQQEANNIQTT